MGFGEAHGKLEALQRGFGEVCPVVRMGLPGWEPHFHGTPWASGSGLCAESHGERLPGEGQKKLALDFLPLRGHLSLSGLRGLQTMGAAPSAPRRDPLCGGDDFSTFLGIPDLRVGKDLRDRQVQSYSFVEEETEASASHFALL